MDKPTADEIKQHEPVWSHGWTAGYESGQRRVRKSDDLDETRRLLYMVLLGGLVTERWYNLGGTLVNALAHHSKLCSAAEVLAIVESIHADGLDDSHKTWARTLINDITDLLDPPKQ